MKKRTIAIVAAVAGLLAMSTPIAHAALLPGVPGVPGLPGLPNPEYDEPILVGAYLRQFAEVEVQEAGQPYAYLSVAQRSEAILAVPPALEQNTNTSYEAYTDFDYSEGQYDVGDFRPTATGGVRFTKDSDCGRIDVTWTPDNTPDGDWLPTVSQTMILLWAEVEIPSVVSGVVCGETLAGVPGTFGVEVDPLGVILNLASSLPLP